jgi:hypothetical protein
MSNDQKRRLGWDLFFGIYGISVAIFALYFNWQWARTHGFMSWLLFGELIATLKAIFWPIYIFLG